MSKKRPPIPVNPMANQFGSGIAIEKIDVEDLFNGHIDAEEARRSHREDGHSFFLLEKGKVSIEIDFQTYTIKPSSIIYIHPNQVHRILTFKNVTVSCWSLTNEHLHPEYLRLLEELTPVQPLVLNKATYALFSEAVALSLKLAARNSDKLSHSLLKDSCNTLVALTISQYLEQSTPAATPTRFENITKSFREALEHHYINDKRPAAYASKLNISTTYLNECVKNTTGYSVSHHIQQRVILEAKRLLSHSDKAVKEIATSLGYDDYPYFSRLFKELTGQTPLTFRNKNRD